MVLDEPNSNLDADGDVSLATAIQGVRQRGGIVIVVAHRPSALANLDQVLVMAGGAVQAFGPKDEVLASVTRPAAQAAAAGRLMRPCRNPRLSFPCTIESDPNVIVSEKRAGSGEGIRANILFGLAVSILLVGGVGAWAATTSLAGAVIASGNVVVESNSKKVQHQTGGIVGEILVKEGDRVSAGDVIVRLDETTTRANLQIIAQQYDRTVARQARLQAERLGTAGDQVPRRASRSVRPIPTWTAVIAGEKALFESRTKALDGLKSQLEARSGQLKKQIEGLTAQRKATEEAAALVERDYTSLQKLYEKKLVSLERVSELQLELSRLQGEIRPSCRGDRRDGRQDQRDGSCRRSRSTRTCARKSTRSCASSTARRSS